MKYFVIVFSLLFWSCGNDPIVPPAPDPTSTIDSDTLSLIWSKELQEESEPTHSMKSPQVYKNHLYISEGKNFQNNWEIHKVDMSNGDYLETAPIETHSKLAKSYGKLHLLSVDTHKIGNEDLAISESHEDEEMRIPTGSYYDSMIFRLTEGSNESYTGIIMRDLSEPNGDWKEVLRQQREGSNWRPFFNRPATEINSEGDTLLYMHSYHWDNEDSLGGFRDRIDIHAYNISKSEYIWSNKDFTPYRGANTGIPKIVGDYIYFVGKVSVFCLDKYTGETIWEQVYVSSEGFLGGNDYIVANDLLYVRGGQGTLRAFDLMTGEVVWQEDGIGSSFNMYVDENYVIYSTATLHVLDAHTGEKLYEHDRYRVNSELTYDPETRKIFVAGAGTLYCFEIPES